MRRTIEVTTLGDALLGAAERWPDAVAVAFPDERVTTSELAARARRRARSLRALGVGRGDRVGIVAPNCMSYTETLLGASLLGAVVVTINARYRATELAYVASNAGLRVLLTSDVLGDEVDFAGLLGAALPGLPEARDPTALSIETVPDLVACVMLGRSTPPGFLPEAEFDALVAGVDEAEIDEAAAAVRVRDVAIMMYSSGTTAQPKGCLLTHEAIVRVGAAINERFSLTEEDVWWDPLPAFHLSHILPLTASLLAGSRFCTMTDFEVDAALDQIARERVTFNFGTFPTVMQELVGHPRFRELDLSHTRIVNQVAPRDMQLALQKALPHAAQVSAYGCTESGGIIAMNDPSEPGELRATTCGRLFPGVEVKIADPETGEEVPVGARGEILVRGWSMFEGYHAAPERNAEAIDADGWFHTGDVGSLDAERRISYHGRTKDMLKVGGENVAALEIESFLSRHPAVRLAQVVGIPDARLVEVPAAFVELEPGQAATEEELIAFFRGEIASFKIPRHVRFVDSWPMSATKIQKFRLRETLVEELGL
ncbi:MAG: AMP-binding protein [Actinobacteria bacterium]|nr:AMP-binding protein [Actinomycetota bacterium]